MTENIDAAIDSELHKAKVKKPQPTIANPQVTRHIMKTFNLRAAKKLGQNFLIDAGIVQGIVDAAEAGPGDRILEIGPGIGITDAQLGPDSGPLSTGTGAAAEAAL